jgi:type VI secretion system protein ImpL
MQFLQGLMGGGQMSLMGLIVFVLITYFSGQYSAFMMKWRAPIIIAGAVIFFIVLIIQKMIAKKSAAAIEDRLQSQAQEQMDTARPDRKPQVQALQKQLTEAIASLKASKMGSGALYSLPWYIIIGPPGSGKSTALQESGLNFPYMSQGRKGIRGVGGTRNCDWWFTDQGILLDTAGRYTTELEDRDEWLSFLDMLKKCRKRKPINGAIVCVSVADLVQCSDEEREAHVKNIRDRIDELTKRLEQIFPVYLVFTKCDLLNGFVDFFEDYGKSDRSQVWGFTLPYSGKVESYQAVFDEEVKKLYGQLSAQRVTSLAAERPADKKRRIFGFPLQFAMAHRRLADFVGELFRPNPFQESSILRGVYFTSGTQEGTPIDQLVAAMGGAFGLQEDAAGLLSQAVDRKSYFINTLFSKVIFGDQNLARSATRVARRRRYVRAAMAAGSVAALIWFSISLGIAFFGNLSLMKSVGATAKKLQDVGKASPQDLAGNLQALEDLRLRIAELDGYTTEDSLPMSLRWGLYRGSEVYLGADKKSGIRKVYVDAINTMFLKNLGETLGREMQQLRDNSNKTDKEFDQLFELLQAYKMVGGTIEAKPELVDSVLKDKERWTQALGPGAAGLSEESKKLASNQRAFYVKQLGKAKDWPDIQVSKTDVNPKLVTDVVENLKGGLWVTQAYQNLITQTPSEYKKVTVESLLPKGYGKDLFECPEKFHVPGAFTQFAYSGYIRSGMREKSQALADKFKQLNVDKSPEVIAGDLRGMYTTDYAVRWRDFFQNIELKNFDNLRDASEKLKVLTAQNSPFRDLFKGVWEGRALQLSERPDDVVNKSSDDRKWLEDAIKALEELQRSLAKLLNTTPPGNRFVAMETQALKELSFSLDNCKGKIESSTKQADLSLAESAARVLNRSLQSTLEAFITESQAEAETLWKRDVYDVFAAKLAGKYPLAADAAQEIPMKTFSEFFNPKSGLFWKTVDKLNRVRDGFKFEDRSLVRFSTDFDECVRKADLFRTGLYAKDAEQMEQVLNLQLGLRSAVVEAVIYIGKKQLSSMDDPDKRGILIWSEADPQGAKIEIRHDDSQRKSIDKFAGQDWGLLRLFALGALVPKTEKLYECTWIFDVKVNGEDVKRMADCALELQKKENPFAPKFFADFKCPDKIGP